MDNIDRYLQRLVESDDHLEVLSEFLDMGGDPNHCIFGDNTLLHVAAQSYQMNEGVIQKLITAGADMELATNVGHTALQFAVITRNSGAVQTLIQAGAYINVQNFFGRTALHYAVDTYHLRNTTRHFLQRYTPDVRIMKMLLDHVYTDINLVDIYGETPLMWAVKHRFLEAVKILLKRGANPNINDPRGENSLHQALSAHTPDYGIITELLLKGASIYDVDKCGKTPVDILLQNFRNGLTIDFVKDLLDIIVFKYHIREDLENKLRRIPALFEHLKKACQEVEWMSKQIIYGEITLHDFGSGCFVLETYKSVVEILLSGEYEIYLRYLSDVMSKQVLINTLRSLVPYSLYTQLLLNTVRYRNQTNLEIFQFIFDNYGEMLLDDEFHQAIL